MFAGVLDIAEMYEAMLTRGLQPDKGRQFGNSKALFIDTKVTVDTLFWYYQTFH